MNRRRPFVCPSVACGVLSFTLANSAHAAPQWNTGLVASGCLLGDRDAVFERVGFCGQARGDILFLRNRVSDFGLGPYLAVGTAAFDDLRVSLGASALVPMIDDFPLVVSLGALGRESGDMGLSSSLFWGMRSYNFHSGYNLAFGFSLAGERTFGSQPSSAFSLGFQVDGFVLALPFLLLVGALQ